MSENVNTTEPGDWQQRSAGLWMESEKGPAGRLVRLPVVLAWLMKVEGEPLREGQEMLCNRLAALSGKGGETLYRVYAHQRAVPIEGDDLLFGMPSEERAERESAVAAWVTLIEAERRRNPRGFLVTLQELHQLQDHPAEYRLRGDEVRAIRERVKQGERPEGWDSMPRKYLGVKPGLAAMAQLLRLQSPDALSNALPVDMAVDQNLFMDVAIPLALARELAGLGQAADVLPLKAVTTESAADAPEDGAFESFEDFAAWYRAKTKKMNWRVGNGLALMFTKYLALGGETAGTKKKAAKTVAKAMGCSHQAVEDAIRTHDDLIRHLRQSPSVGAASTRARS